MFKRHMPVMISVLVATFVLLQSHTSTADSAEASAQIGNTSHASELPKRPNHRRFNVRLTGGPAFALTKKLEDRGLGDVGAVGAIGIDWVLVEPLAFSVFSGYGAFVEGNDGALQDLFVTVGFRLRLFTDTSGALTEKGGNLAGHLFLDGHFGYHSYERQEHAGYNVGLGYEMAIAKDFNLGPFVRFSHTPIGDGFSYMALSFGIQVSVGGKFEPDDADKDGIEDADDRCPLEPEDADKFEDEDGCPDPDNDRDGVPDVNDQCPETAGVAANQGCEDNDTDRDGVLNDADSCIDEPEDIDGFEDEDGCPDPDNDGDTIADNIDKCPNDAEDVDGFEDEDGCPDTDNDGDKVPDAADQCPFIPETRNGIDDQDGCPDFITLSGNRILLEQQVAFDAASTVPQTANPMLDELVALLKLKKDLQIRVEAHTDNRGGKKQNEKKSQARAAAVKAYLVEKGIDARRVEAKGLGQSTPVADNKTKEGREKNNRIEIYVVNAPSAAEKESSAAPTDDPAKAPAQKTETKPGKKTDPDKATPAMRAPKPVKTDTARAPK